MSRELMGSLEPDWPPAHCPSPQARRGPHSLLAPCSAMAARMYMIVKSADRVHLPSLKPP